MIGVKRQHTLIKNILNFYEKTNSAESFYNNNDLFTKFFLDNFSAFRLNGKYQKLEGGITIYPKEYFERPTYKKSIDYAIHHCKGSWRDNPKTGLSKKWVKMILGNVLWSKLSHLKAIRRCPYYEIYLKDRN